MITFTIIVATIFAMLAIICLICAFDDDPVAFILSLLFGVFSCITFDASNDKINKHHSSEIYTYKVKELEKNTMFIITDSIGGYYPTDSVWISNNLKINPLDSTAMKCVIVKEIK